MLDADSWVDKLTAASAAKESGDGGTLHSLPTGVLHAAYRFHTPCLCKHTTAQNRTVNCRTSPWCFAGFQAMPSEAAALMECTAFIVGDGPTLLQQCSDEVGAVSPPRRGIRNLGSTCYLNVVLQLLFSIPEVQHEVFRAYSNVPVIEDYQNSTLVNDATRNTAEKDCPVTKSFLSASGLGELFAEIAFSRDGRGADPHSFVSFLSLDVSMQQDAQEFFALLIDCLRREGGDVIGRVFEGNLLYDRRCNSCRHSFKRAEPFYFLSLPVKSTLEEALKTFFLSEEVEGFQCDECGTTATAFSRQYVRTLPDVFVVHLNRFTFDLETLQRKKVTKNVKFPLEWDLTDYVDEWQQRDKTLASEGQKAPSVEALYTLIGVVNHIGETAHSGHYTFHGKMGEVGGWHQVDDAEVTKLHHRFRGTHENSKDAYMLVYRRRKPAAPHSACKRDVDATCTPSVADGDFSLTTVLPSCLMEHVQHLNQELEMSRLSWELGSAEVMTFVQAWGKLSQEIFGSSIKSSQHLGGAKEEEELADLVAIPSSWLQLFGRCFLPSCIDVGQYDAGGKRKKRVRGNPVSSGIPIILEDDSAVHALAGGIEGNVVVTEEESKAQAEVVSDELQMSGLISLEGVSQSQLDVHMSSLRCPHGGLSPWGAYKLLSVAAAESLALLLRSTPPSLMSCASSDKIRVPFVGWRVREHKCLLCAASVAAEVRSLKAAWEEEKNALALLDMYEGDDFSHSNNNNDNINNDNNNDNIMSHGGGNDATDTDNKTCMYVGEGVIECWMKSLMSNTKRKNLVSCQGFTGLVAASRMGQTEGVEVLSPSFIMPPRLLCDHHRLSPSAAVRVVPKTLWRYLRERVVWPMCRWKCDVNEDEGDALASAQLDEVLPCLPAKSTCRCQDCVRITVVATTERHLAKLTKMEEAKRFPTIAIASQILSLPQAEMEAQHPNRLIWKRNLDRLHREHCRLWEKEHAATISAMESQIAALRAEEEKERRAQEEWYNAMVNRGNRNRRRKNQYKGVHNIETSSSAMLQASEGVDTTTSTATTPSALQLACEGLAVARAKVCPELYQAYGCIPMWWVVQWRKWYTDLDGAVPPPACFEHVALRCSHGKALFAPHLLDLSDPFWEMRGIGNHIMRVWRRQVGDTVSSVVWDADIRGLPPLLLLPMKEFVDVLKTYGRCDMLLPEEAKDGQEAEERKVNPANVVLFTERSTERVFDPPSCEICSVVLLKDAEKSFRHFLNGSLGLQLHLRRSKRHFYDASDVLRGMHYTTTLAELKLAILQRVKEEHGYILPMKGMEILCRRKPLRRIRSSCPENKTSSSTDHAGAFSFSEVPICLSSGDRAVIDVDAMSVTSCSQVDEEDCTLFEYGICDGDVLTVNYTERALEKLKETPEMDVWEEIPAELLHSTPENLTAFAATRLYATALKPLPTGGDHVDSSLASHVACCVCTFINTPGRTTCEMCETPLGRAA